MGRLYRKIAVFALCAASLFYAYPDYDVLTAKSGQESSLIYEHSVENSDSTSDSDTVQNSDNVISAVSGYYSYSAAESFVNENDAFSCVELSVKKGEKYRITGTVWGWACLYKIADSENNIIDIYDWDGKYRTDISPEKFDVTVDIPSNAAKLLVSFKNDEPASIEKLKSSVQNTSEFPGAAVSSETVQSGTQKTGYSYAISRTLCIGDSLTSGAYFRAPLPRNMKTGDSVSQNYPYYLKRMNNMDTVTNAGVSGITVNGWLTSEYKKYTMSDYDSFIIWLGTNNGILGSVEADVNPYDKYSQYANTGVGNYCTIIEKIKEDNPDCLILMCTVYGTTNGADVTQTNENIRAIADKYGITVIDMSDLSFTNRPDLHGNYNNIHFSKAGNIFVANRIINEIDSVLSSSPDKAEFGLTKRTD